LINTEKASVDSHLSSKNKGVAKVGQAETVALPERYRGLIAGGTR
jgi:hypothetical protein